MNEIKAIPTVAHVAHLLAMLRGACIAMGINTEDAILYGTYRADADGLQREIERAFRQVVENRTEAKR